MGSPFMLIKDEKVHEPEGLQFLAYTFASMTTLWIYDFACSFHEELTFLLRSRWTKVKGLYVIARYVPFLILITYQFCMFNSSTHLTDYALTYCASVYSTPNENPNKCHMVKIIYFFLSVISIACSEFLFLLRTYVLWNKNGIVLIAMLFIFSVVAVASIAVDVVTVDVSHVATNMMQGTQGCYRTLSGVQISITFLLLFGFQLGLALLTLIRAVQRWRAVNYPLYDVLVKHNIFYYTCGLLLSAINILTQTLLSKTAYPHVCEDFQFYLLAILATRMHLFLWQTDQQTHGSDTLVHIPMSDVSPADSMVTTV
ncbi:uncharacterized protein F5147DRAFT_18766 [Suillus discolor]|uniref:DUF6533 domain-containing protein n=1 Tax=Suillus discolor TaxID=1912936 RepID=A0A9P7JXE7_9AGAM|nr:uncharacterized protein F5147DRAFT_18766 [Suillus discolor]KAG2114193.1 hypothetical protein F5147DRAFT_18766 [Suillus discolor]